MGGAQNYGNRLVQILVVVVGIGVFVGLTGLLNPLQAREHYGSEPLVDMRCQLVDREVVFTATLSFDVARELDNNFSDRDHFRLHVDAKYEDTDIGGSRVTFYPYRTRERAADRADGTQAAPNGDVEVRIPVGRGVTIDGLSCFPSVIAYG